MLRHLDLPDVSWILRTNRQKIGARWLCPI